LLESVCQQLIEAEMSRYLGAEAYERTDERIGYRNGYKNRTLKTRVGQLQFQVPQSRDGKFSPEIFQRYQRSEKALRLTLMEMVLHGVTTRKVAKVTEELCGTGFSASMVSQLCTGMDESLEMFRTRPLTGKYPYVMVDARYQKTRMDHQVISQAVLIIVGVNQDGYREVLAVEVVALESASTWGDIFQRLRKRGLKGVRLVVSDNHLGIKEAVSRHFCGSLWQRCRFHFSRNVCGKLSLKDRATMAKALRRIWELGTWREAQDEIHKVADAYRRRYPDVAVMLEEDMEDTFAVETLPPEHQRRLATTNGLERVNETLKSRTRLVRIFPNRESCLRMHTALLQEIHEDWITGHRYVTFSEEEAIAQGGARTITEEQDHALTAVAP